MLPSAKVALAHEIPQELGDFGILVHSGSSRYHELAFTLASAATVRTRRLRLVRPHPGGSADPVRRRNFVYIALTDLVPELTTSPGAHHKAINTVGLVAGLALLWSIAAAGS